MSAVCFCPSSLLSASDVGSSSTLIGQRVSNGNDRLQDGKLRRRCHTKFVPAAKFVPGASSIRNPLQICLATDDRFVRCLATDDRVE